MRRFGLIGRPLGHSASAAYFTEKFNREGVTDCTRFTNSGRSETCPVCWSVSRSFAG